MTTRGRDDHPVEAVVKSKENRSQSPAKQTKSFIPSLIKSPDRSEFFTDSYLGNDASQSSIASSASSRLPTIKSRFKPSRSEQKVDGVRPRHKSAQSESQIPRPREIRIIHKRSQANGTSPIRESGLTTPPRSRDESSLVSPISTFSSPPRALTDTYERISQEEDLAATEGEFSDPESVAAAREHGEDFVTNNAAAPPHHHTLEVLSASRSRGATPTREHHLWSHREIGHGDDATDASIRSDPTGYSFLDGISDRNLAQALTPMAKQSFEDRRALHRVWAGKKLTAFSRANTVNPASNASDQHILLPSVAQPERLKAFTKVGRIKLDSDYLMRPQHHRTFSDVTQEVGRSRDDHEVPSRNDNWHSEKVTKEVMPHNPRLHRPPYFARTHGFPARQPSARDGGETLAEITNGHVVRAMSDSPKTHQSYHQNAPEQRQKHIEAVSSTVNGTVQPSDGLDRSKSKDDAHIQEDKASRFGRVEAGDNQKFEPARPQSMTRSDMQDDSPQKSRRFDVDFTGQSFQVSDSPPVRIRSSPQEYTRHREIEGLAKQAVTTNRLTQLRARESREKLRNGSKSPILEATEDAGSIPELLMGSENGEVVPGTPVIIYRTSSNVANRSSSTPKFRPSPEHRDSYDLLQRLARGSSSTPRSSSNSAKAATQQVRQSDFVSKTSSILGEIAGNQSTSPSMEAASNSARPIGSSNLDTLPETQHTPKPVGAWTDTILPETLRAVRRDKKPPQAQTPHISAGGWIDTPAPNGPESRLEVVPETTSEIPVELVGGTTKDNSHVSNGDSRWSSGAKDTAGLSDRIIQASDPQMELRHMQTSAETQSMAQKVLGHAKERLALADTPPATFGTGGEDTLNLNPSTLQSLEDFLNVESADVTTLSRLSTDLNTLKDDDTYNTVTSLSDTQVLSRLSAKIDKVMLAMKDARKGISHLEEQIIHPVTVKLQTDSDSTLKKVNSVGDLSHVPSVVKSMESQQQVEVPDEARERTSTPTRIPIGLMTLTFPVPLLFRVARKDLNQRFARPTMLGWVIIGLWTWYMLETTLAELFSHPQSASNYVWPDQPEPEFPFVLPTMLWRWSQLDGLYPYTVQPVTDFLIALCRMIGIMFGLTDGFVDPVGRSRVGEAIFETASVLASSASAQGGALDMNMMNDEFL